MLQPGFWRIHHRIRSGGGLQTLKNRLALLGLVFLGAIIILSAHGLRFSRSESVPTYDQYKFLFLVSRLDGFSLTHPYESLMAMAENPLSVSRVILFVSGLATCIIFAAIISRLGSDWKYSILVFILSPMFIHSYSVQNDYAFALMFFGLGILLLLNQLHFPSMLLIGISFFLNQRFFLPIILLLSYVLYRTKPKAAILSVIVMAASTYVFTLVSVWSITPGPQAIMGEFISDFGADPGVGIFEMLLFGIGILYAWRKKKEHIMPLYLVCLLAIASAFDKTMLVFFVILSSFYGGYALSQLIRRAWESQMLKSYVIILFICGLVFSSGASLKRLSDSPPAEAEILSLEWLKDQEKGIVLSDFKYGYMIEAISSQKPYLDKDYYLQSRDKIRINATYEIFMSREYYDIRDFMTKNSITYIWVNGEMKQGFPWTNEDEGMQLILRNVQDFELIFHYEGIEIWKFHPELQDS
jgi:hypothetical protein